MEEGGGSVLPDQPREGISSIWGGMKEDKNIGGELTSSTGRAEAGEEKEWRREV